MTYNPNPLYHQAHQLIYQTNEDKNDAISDVVDNSLSFDPWDNRAYNSENTIQHRIKTEQVDDSDQTYDFDEDHDETQYQDISETKPISAIFELADNDILKSKINGLLYSNGIKYATNEAVTWLSNNLTSYIKDIVNRMKVKVNYMKMDHYINQDRSRDGDKTIFENSQDHNSEDGSSKFAIICTKNLNKRLRKADKKYK